MAPTVQLENYMESLVFSALGSVDLSLFHDIRMGIISVVVEALPFLLIGSLVASIIHLHLSEKTLQRFFERPLPLQMIIATFTGVFFPLCECAMIPVVRNLIRKGLPVPTGIVLMMATPIVNPIAVFSTHVAFKSTIPNMPIYRVLAGVAISICIGLTFIGYRKEKVLKEMDESHDGSEPSGDQTVSESGFWKRILNVIRLTKKEFFSVATYLVIGAVCSTFIYFLLPNSVVTTVAENDIAAVPAFGLFGYLVSLCSNADAFLVAPFAGRFSVIALLSFLIISPIIDLKNTFILFSMFNRRFSVQLLIKMFIVVFASLGIVMLVSRNIS